MSEYYIGLYSKDQPFDKDVVQTALRVISERLPEFFPARMDTSENSSETIKTPDDFSYEMIPTGFWVEEDISVRIPIHGNNGAELTILDDRDSTLIPSNVLISWTDESKLPDFTTLHHLFSGLVEALKPTSAIVTEEEMGLRDDIYERSFQLDNTQVPEALSWMTWLGPKHVQSIGEAGLKNVKDSISLEPCGSGYILSLMKEPYKDGNPEHLQFREDIEQKIGLTAIYEAL